ncbi:MAG: ABC transporter substrate-binding protein [Thermostichales cyanobacterium SZTDM-1c_bins_54]
MRPALVALLLLPGCLLPGLGAGLPALARPAPPRTLVQQHTRVRVAVDPALGSPYFYTDLTSRSYRGVEWELLQTLAERLRWQLEPVYIPWGDQLTALEQGEVDLVLGAREATGLDLEKFRVTRPYLWTMQRLVVRRPDADNITRLSDLFGRRVGVVVDSAGAALMEAYNRRRGNAIQLFASSQPLRLFQQLRSGQLDALLIDQAVAILHTKDGELQMVGPGLLPTPLVAITRHDAESLQTLTNQAITEIQQDGTWQMLLEAWQLWDPALTTHVSTKD